MLAVTGMPRLGKPAELLAAAGIDAEHIAEAARALVRTGVARLAVGHTFGTEA